MKVPHNVFNMVVGIGAHHLEDLVEKDGDPANTHYGFRSAGATAYRINIFRTWHRRHVLELRRMRNMEAPLWQTAPKKWAPLRVQPETSRTPVGGREAKKEKMATVVQGAYPLEVEQDYMKNRPGASPAYVPMCHASRRGPHIDLRIYRAIVFIYQVTSQCNAGPYTPVLHGLQDRPAAERYQDQTGNTIVWFAHEPTVQ